MDNKSIANYELSFIGGNPEVNEYYNDDKTMTIDILKCVDGDDAHYHTHATIGLSDVSVGLTVDDKELRIELIVSGIGDDDIFGNIIASASFSVMSMKESFYGMIIDNIVSDYIKDSEMKHIVLMSPVYWDKYKIYNEDKCVISWLMIVPISDTEKNYILDKGVDAFEKLLEENNVNVADLHRKSVV